MTDDKRAISTTTSGTEPTVPHGPAPTEERRPDGQHAAYWVLSEAERARGFVRPVRRSYRHVGVKPRYPLRDLTPEQRKRFPEALYSYVAFEAYPEDESPVTGRYWTRAELDGSCGAVTTMATTIAETYARDPGYYGSTFCAGCGEHLPVGEDGAFVWLDASGADTAERVGT